MPGRGVGEKDSLGHTVTEISHENVDLRRQVCNGEAGRNSRIYTVLVFESKF